GSGAQGWQGVSTEALSARAVQLLAQKYVCVYVDASKPDGRALADELAVRGKAGLVLSTRGGESQAFHHQGQLTRRDLETAVARAGAMALARVHFSATVARREREGEPGASATGALSTCGACSSGR